MMYSVTLEKHEDMSSLFFVQLDFPFLLVPTQWNHVDDNENLKLSVKVQEVTTINKCSFICTSTKFQGARQNFCK